MIGTSKLRLEKTMIKPHVVSDKDRPRQICTDNLGHLGKGGGAGDHRISDAGHLLDKGRNRTTWIH